MDNYKVSCLSVNVIDKGNLILVISNRYKGREFFFFGYQQPLLMKRILFWLQIIHGKNFF